MHDCGRVCRVPLRGPGGGGVTSRHSLNVLVWSSYFCDPLYFRVGDTGARRSVRATSGDRKGKNGKAHAWKSRRGFDLGVRSARVRPSNTTVRDLLANDRFTEAVLGSPENQGGHCQGRGSAKEEGEQGAERRVEELFRPLPCHFSFLFLPPFIFLSFPHLVLVLISDSGSFSGLTGRSHCLFCFLFLASFLFFFPSGS